MTLPERCRICRSERGNILFEKRYGTADPVQIVQFAGCKTQFTYPFPKTQDLRDLYQTSYFHCASPLQGGYEDYQSDEPQIAQTFERRWHLFKHFLKSDTHPRVLDVGCATGVFLEVMKMKG